MARRIIISVINDIAGDQRIHRIATTLQKNGYEVWVVGRLLPDSTPLSPKTYQTHRMKLWFRKGKFFYLEFFVRLFFFLMGRKADILNANDLDTLLANFLAAKLKRAALVYDTHEYFTEVPELIDRPLTRRIWLILERWIFPKLKHSYSVNGMIASIYTKQYQVPVHVIRNLPFRRSSRAVQPKQNVLIYQGAMNLGRGIELMIKAMHFLPEYELWLIGRGDLDRELEALIVQEELEVNIRKHGFVPGAQLHTFTVQALLGLSLEEDRGANYRFATPNKVYDYVQAGVPVLVSDLPAMREVVQTHGVGEILPKEERSPELVAQRIRSIVTSKTKYDAYTAACYQAAEELCWEREEEKLLNIYNVLGC